VSGDPRTSGGGHLHQGSHNPRAIVGDWHVIQHTSVLASDVRFAERQGHSPDLSDIAQLIDTLNQELWL
jgi:hypothetical protein